MNARFHALLNELSGSAPVIREIDRVSALPFASPSGFVMAQSALPEAHQILLIAQDHHRIVVDAIENREGARAEAIMREHSRLAARNLRLALRNRAPSRSAAGAGAAQIVRRLGARHALCRAMELVHRRGDPRRRRRRSANSACVPTTARCAPCPPGSHISVAVLIDGQPARRSYSLVGERRSRHLSHRGAAGAGQPRRLARHVEFASRARGSKSPARRR